MLASAKGKVRSLTACSQASFFVLISLFTTLDYASTNVMISSSKGFTEEGKNFINSPCSLM